VKNQGADWRGGGCKLNAHKTKAAHMLMVGADSPSTCNCGNSTAHNWVANLFGRDAKWWRGCVKGGRGEVDQNGRGSGRIVDA